MSNVTVGQLLKTKDRKRSGNVLLVLNIEGGKCDVLDGDRVRKGIPQRKLRPLDGRDFASE